MPVKKCSILNLYNFLKINVSEGLKTWKFYKNGVGVGGKFCTNIIPYLVRI